MNWNDFIRQQTQPAATASIHEDCVCALTSLGRIRIGGEDRVEFLHSQLTRDLHRLVTGQATLTAWCNPKGRVIATFLLVRHENHIDLLVASELKETVVRRLRMFVLRARVAVEEPADDACMGISGKNSAAVLAENFSGLHQEDWQCSPAEDMTAIRLPGPVPRYLVYGRHEALQMLWQQSLGTCKPVTEAHWTLLNIEAGLPWIDQAVSEQFLPQMLNLDRIGGLDFNKGCYPGQEVIARLHYRGEVKQRLQRGLSVHTEALPGTSLYNATGERSGHIVNVAQGPDGQLYALAVTVPDVERLHIGDSQGAIMAFTS